MEREIKRTNERLTKRNAKLYDSLQEIKRKHTKLEESNPRLRKDKIRLSKLQKWNSISQSQAHQKLETLAEVAMSLFGPEVAYDAASIPNPRQAIETPKDKHCNLKKSG